MADGAATPSSMENGFWQAQTELARTVNRLAEQVGSVTAQLDERVTNKEMMKEFNGFRTEFGGKMDHMEVKFDQASEKVEHKLDRAVDRIKENLASLTAKAVDDAMTARRSREQEAMATINNREQDIDRRIRAANRTAFGGGILGLIGVLYGIAQQSGFWGG